MENVGRRPVIRCTRVKKVENEIMYCKEIVESIYIYIYIEGERERESRKSEGILYVVQNQSLIEGFQSIFSPVIIIYIGKSSTVL
jgi:hypothetical protein